VQLTGELRVLTSNVQKHQEAMQWLGTLRHAVRRVRSVRALNTELLRYGDARARRGFTQFHSRFELSSVLAECNFAVVPPGQKHCSAGCTACVWCPTGARVVRAARIVYGGRSCRQTRCGARLRADRLHPPVPLSEDG
jgi:hypothetical protein